MTQIAVANTKMHTEIKTCKVFITDVEQKVEPTRCEKHARFVVLQVTSQFVRIKNVNSKYLGPVKIGLITHI